MSIGREVGDPIPCNVNGIGTITRFGNEPILHNFNGIDTGGPFSPRTSGLGKRLSGVQHTNFQAM